MTWIVKVGDTYADWYDELHEAQKQAFRYTSRTAAEMGAMDVEGGRVVKLVPKTDTYVLNWGLYYVESLIEERPGDWHATRDLREAMRFDKEAAEIVKSAWAKFGRGLLPLTLRQIDV